MYHGARLRWRNAEAQHDGGGCYPKCHAERPVYQLGEQPHEEKEQPGLVHAPPLQFITGRPRDRLGWLGIFHDDQQEAEGLRDAKHD